MNTLIDLNNYLIDATTVIRILYLLSILTFLVVPFLCYQSTRMSMVKFYFRMALNHRCRLFYRRILLAFLMIIHFYHLTLFQNQYEVIFSTLACIPLFNHKLSERIFYVLQNKRMIYMLALLTLILLFTPHGFISAITVATYIYGAVLYPSMRIREKMMMPKTRYEIKQAPYSIVPIYFRWRDSI